MTRSISTDVNVIHCLCGSEPHCPFHSPSFTGESAQDRCHREAREAVRKTSLRTGETKEYGGADHAARRAFDLAVMAESTRRLSVIGVVIEVGLATPESIAQQRRTVVDSRKPIAPLKIPRPPLPALPRGPLPTTRRLSPGYMLVLVPMFVGGRARDRYEAAVDFAGEPWAKDARHLGSSINNRDGGSKRDGVHLFERPDAAAQLRDQRQSAEAIVRPVIRKRPPQPPQRNRDWRRSPAGKAANRKARSKAYWRRKLDGTCVDCGAKALDDCNRCSVHRDQQRMYAKSERRKQLRATPPIVRAL